MPPQEVCALSQLTPKTHWGEALLPSARAYLPVTGSSHSSFDARDGQIHGFPTTAPLPSQTWVKPRCPGCIGTFMVASSGSFSFELLWRAEPHLQLFSPYKGQTDSLVSASLRSHPGGDRVHHR